MPALTYLSAGMDRFKHVVITTCSSLSASFPGARQNWDHVRLTGRFLQAGVCCCMYVHLTGNLLWVLYAGVCCMFRGVQHKIYTGFNKTLYQVAPSAFNVPNLNLRPSSILKWKCLPSARPQSDYIINTQIQQVKNLPTDLSWDPLAFMDHGYTIIPLRDQIYSTVE